MKLRANRKALADTATWVAQAISKNPPHPEMAGIRITASETDIVLDGYNYETAHCATVAADVGEPGSVLVSARLFTGILSALKADTVELALDDKRFTITAGRSNYRLGVMRVDHYPAPPTHPATVATVGQGDLEDLIGTVEHAAERVGLVEALHAIYVTGDGKHVTATATDRFRIARRSAPCAKGGKKFEALVPAGLIGASVRGLTGTVDIGHSDGLLGLSDGSRSVTTRLVDLEYARLDSFFEKPLPITATLNAPELLAAIKRALLVLDNPATQTLGFEFDHENEELRITGDGVAGEALEPVTCQVNEDLKVGFNGTFVAQALALIGDTDITFELATTYAAARITPTDDTTTRFVVMPRRKA